MGEDKIDKVVRDLVADHDRLDGFLSKAHVERLFEKRQLTVEESTEVHRQLDNLGISIEDEVGSQDEIEDPYIDSMDSVNSLAEGSLKHLDARLLSMHSKLLTADEEVELGRRMELGRRALHEIEEGIPCSDQHNKIIERGRDAKDAMVKANLRLVLHIAKPYIGLSDLSLDDLFQEGVIGLMRAADKFDHTLGYKFSTYATWWIRQSLTRSISDRGTTIRLPVHAYNDVLRLKRAHKLLAQAHPERWTSLAELAEELVWSIDKVHFIQQCATFVPTSLDEKIHGYDELTLMDTLPSSFPSPEEHQNEVDLARCINEALNGLKGRESKVLSLRFGLGNFGYGSTLEEIGKEFKLTRERIRQIESKALGQIKESSLGVVLRDILDS